MADRAPLPLAAGESFRPTFEANIAELLNITTIEAALPDDNSGDPRFPAEAFAGAMFDPASIPPVRIAFVDGAKSWLGLRTLLAGLRFERGGLLVLQDYPDPFSYWVPMLMTAVNAKPLGGRCMTFRAPFDVSGLPATISDVGTDQGLAWLAGSPLAAAVFGRVRDRTLELPPAGLARDEVLVWLGLPAEPKRDLLRPLRLVGRGLRASLGLAR
jgi:hypothetical protein